MAVTTARNVSSRRGRRRRAGADVAECDVRNAHSGDPPCERVAGESAARRPARERAYHPANRRARGVMRLASRTERPRTRRSQMEAASLTLGAGMVAAISLFRIQEAIAALVFTSDPPPPRSPAPAALPSRSPSPPVAPASCPGLDPSPGARCSPGRRAKPPAPRRARSHAPPPTSRRGHPRRRGPELDDHLVPSPHDSADPPVGYRLRRAKASPRPRTRDRGGRVPPPHVVRRRRAGGAAARRATASYRTASCRLRRRARPYRRGAPLRPPPGALPLAPPDRVRGPRSGSRRSSSGSCGSPRAGAPSSSGRSPGSRRWRRRSAAPPRWDARSSSSRGRRT